MLTAFYASPTSQSSELLKRWKNIAAVANRESETFFLQNRESKQKIKLEKTVEKMFNFNLPKHTRILDVMLDTWCKKIFIAYNKLEIILRCHKKFEQHYILSPMWMWMQRKKKTKFENQMIWSIIFFLREIEGEQKNCVLVYIGGCYWNRSGSTWQPKYVKTIDVSLPWLDGIQKLNRELWVALKPSATKMWKKGDGGSGSRSSGDTGDGDMIEKKKWMKR